MDLIVRLILNQKKLGWRRIGRELPEIFGFLEEFSNRAVYVVAGFIVCLLLAIVFLLAVGILKLAGIFLHEAPLGIIQGLLAVVAALILLSALGEIGGVSKALRYYLGDKQLLGVFPITWKQIYLARLVSRSGQEVAFIWILVGAGVLAAQITLVFPWQVVSSWLVAVLPFLIFVFALRDCLAVVLAGLGHLLKKIAGPLWLYLSPLVMFTSWIVLVILSAGVCFIISTIFTNAEVMANHIVTLGAWTYEILVTTPNPLAWVANALCYAASGDPQWMKMSLYLFFTAVTVSVVLERSLNYLDNRGQLPFDVSSGPDVAESKVKKYHRTPLILPLCRLLPFPFSVLLRKDLIQLPRDPVAREQCSFLAMLAAVVVGALIGFWLSGAWARWTVTIEKLSSSFSKEVPQTLALMHWLIIPLMSGCIVVTVLGGLGKITGFDADGRNIGFWRSAPIELRSVAYGKMLLHFSMAVAVAVVTSAVCVLVLKAPLTYLTAAVLVVLCICICGTLTVIHVGATILYPRFDWQHRGEVGGTYKAFLFGSLEIVYVVGLFYLMFAGLVLIEYFGVLVPLSLLSLLVGAFFVFASYGLIYTILRVITKKLAD
jgi:hypothetical protein